MIAQVGSALHAALAADATLSGTYGVTGVHADLAPRGAAYPFIVFSLVTAPDRYTFAARAWTDSLWQVKAYDDQPSTERVARIAERVDELLTDQAFTVTGHRTLVVRRTDSLPTLPEVDSDTGLQIRSAGAYFQWGVQET